MTIPIDIQARMRGPRQTLLTLTEAYLRRGELGADARSAVARLAERVGVGAGMVPDWGPLASTLAAMLRGEAERALMTVVEAVRSGGASGAIQRALLDLGVRAALATNRPTLARRWRADLPQRDLDGRDAVWASLPEAARELLEGDVSPERATQDGPGGPSGDEATAGPSAAGVEAGARSRPLLHLVMDAYHGDVVTMPVRVEVLSSSFGETRHEVPEELDGLAGAGDHPLLAVRVASDRTLPDPPEAQRWHVRFVGRVRALDARSSDGTLVDLSWIGDGFVALLHPPEYVEEMDVEADVLASRVTHVVVVPEAT